MHDQENTQQYPKQLACDRIGSEDSSIVMLEQRGREAVVKNLTISVLEGFSLRPLSEANLLTILLCSVAPWVEVAIVLTLSAWAAPPRYRLQMDTPAFSCRVGD